MGAGRREAYYSKLKVLSSEIKEEWEQITSNNKRSFVTLSAFATRLNSSLTTLKKEREREITDLDKTNELLTTTETIHKSILNDIKDKNKELKTTNNELVKQKNTYSKISEFIKNIKNNLATLKPLQGINLNIPNGKNIINDTINDVAKSIKGLLPIIKTAVIVLTGVLNSVFKNIANGINAFFIAVSDRGISGLRKGIKDLSNEFGKIGNDLSDTLSNAKDVYKTLLEISKLEKQVEAQTNLVGVAQNRLDVLREQKELLDNTNISLQDRLSVLAKQYAFEQDVINANLALLNAKKELVKRELFIAKVQKENTINKESELTLLNSETDKLNKQANLLKQIFQIEKTLTIIRDVSNKANLDKVKIVEALNKEIQQLRSTVQSGFVLEKEVELSNKAIQELSKQAKIAFETIKESTKASIDTDFISNALIKGIDPTIVKGQLLQVKGINKEVIDEIIEIYSNYYETVKELQNQNYESNKEIVERNKQAVLALIEVEYEARKTAIESTLPTYLDFRTILSDIEASNVNIFAKTIQSVNALKRGYIELGKQYDDNVAKIEKYQSLLEEVDRTEAFFIKQIEQRNDLTEQEKQTEIEKIKQRYQIERNEIRKTVKELTKSNDDIRNEQNGIRKEITDKYNALFATIFDNLSNIASQVTTELNAYLSRQQGYIDNYITRLQNMYNVQQALLGKVSDLQSDRINREIARAEAEKRRIERQKEAIETVNTLLQTYNSYLQAGNKPQQALLNAIKDILLIKTISRAIKGRFAKGIEGFKGKGTDTSDENLVLISNNESIVTAQATRKYKGLVTAMNKGNVNEWIQQNSVVNYGKNYNYDFIKLGNTIASIIKTNDKYTVK